MQGHLYMYIQLENTMVRSIVVRTYTYLYIISPHEKLAGISE